MPLRSYNLPILSDKYSTVGGMGVGEEKGSFLQFCTSIVCSFDSFQKMDDLQIHYPQIWFHTFANVSTKWECLHSWHAVCPHIVSVGTHARFIAGQCTCTPTVFRLVYDEYRGTIGQTYEARDYSSCMYKLELACTMQVWAKGLGDEWNKPHLG